MSEESTSAEFDAISFGHQTIPDLTRLLSTDFNQTALAILYERLNRQRECMDRDLREPRCEETGFYRLLMGYGFLVLCFVAVVGNCLNLLVYVSDQMRFFVAIRMLCTKLLANTLTMLVLLPQACRSVGLWEAGAPNDQLYWKYWPYQAFFGNFFGFTGMWLTVLMTAECYFHVFLPLKSKSICTMRNVWRSYVVIAIMGTLLGIIYPLNRSVVLSTECDNVEVAIVVTDSQFLGMYERFHMLANMLFAIVVPLGLLVFMTACIVWRLVGKAAYLGEKCSVHRQSAGGSQKGRADSTSSVTTTTNINNNINNMSNLNNNSSTVCTNGAAHNGTSGPTPAANGAKTVGRFNTEKRSVTRITLITTVFQLFGELPSVPIFMLASVFEPGTLDRLPSLCFWQTLSQFLGLCNVSLSFFVYIAFSPRFRRAIIARFRCGNKYLQAIALSLNYTKPTSPHDSRYPPTPDVPASATTSLIQTVRQAHHGRLSVDCLSPTQSSCRFNSEIDQLL